MGPASRFRYFTDSRLFKYGLPFFTLMIGGSLWLRQFAQLRYEYRTVKHVSWDEFQDMVGKGKPIKRVSEEQMLKEVLAETEDDYEMVRGPRPWEDQGARAMENIKRHRKEERDRKREQKRKLAEEAGLIKNKSS